VSLCSGQCIAPFCKYGSVLTENILLQTQECLNEETLSFHAEIDRTFHVMSNRYESFRRTLYHLHVIDSPNEMPFAG
jgi:hypothetical protein